MPLVSIVCGAVFSRADLAAVVNLSASGPSTTTAIPGLVQNWPAPSVSEPDQPEPIASARAGGAAGSRNIGLTLPSPQKKEIGSGRGAHRSKSPRPPAREPVK